MAQVKAIVLRAGEVGEIWKTKGEQDDRRNKIANT